MKKLFIIFTLCVFVLGFVNPALCMSGNEAYKQYKSYKDAWIEEKENLPNKQMYEAISYQSYIGGIWETFAVYQLPYAFTDGNVKVPENLTLDQMLQLFGEYLKNHPESRHEKAVYLFMDCLKKHYSK